MTLSVWHLLSFFNVQSKDTENTYTNKHTQTLKINIISLFSTRKWSISSETECSLRVFTTESFDKGNDIIYDDKTIYNGKKRLDRQCRSSWTNCEFPGATSFLTHELISIICNPTIWSNRCHSDMWSECQGLTVVLLGMHLLGWRVGQSNTGCGLTLFFLFFNKCR